MELRQLRHFLAIVEEQSISAAAARLHMTQPPLTSLVNALEKEVGGRLLDRHARGVTPTAAGRELAVHARRLLQEVSATIDSVRALGNGATGTLSVAMVASASWELMPQLLAEYRISHADVHVTLEDLGGPMPTIDAVRRRQVECAIVYTTDPGRLASGYARDMTVTTVRREPMVLIVPRPGTPPRRRGPARLSRDDLAARTWLTTSTTSNFPGLNQALRGFWRRLRIEPEVRTVGSLGIARTFVQAGVGVAAVNRSMLTGLPDNVVEAGAPERLDDLYAVLVHLAAEPPSAPLQAFLSLAREVPDPDEATAGQ